jgi:hypothetical protein
MASIGPVKLQITLQELKAEVDVTYDISFDEYDQKTDQVYVEVCKLIGDDTGTGDELDAGPDDVIGYLTPLFFRNTRANGARTLARHFTKVFRTADLNEDRGTVSNPDEIRALVTLTPVMPSAVKRESNLVTAEI